MKFSRLEFFKMLGSGSAALGATIAARGGAVSVPITAGQVERPIYPPADPSLVDREFVDPSRAWERSSIAPPYYDVIPWTLYDRFHLSPASELPAAVHFFSRAHGEKCEWCVQTKTDTHTNSYIPGRLPMPFEFWVRRIFFLADPDTRREDLLLASRAYSWRFIMGQKVFAGPRPLMLNMPAPGDRGTLVRKDGRPRRLVPSTALDGAWTFRDSAGVLIPEAWVFSFPMYLDDQFAGATLSPDGTVGFSMFIGLDGLLKRPVQ